MESEERGPMSGTDASKAKCLVNTAETLNFNNYVNTCRTSQDTIRANNLFSSSISNFQDTFKQLRGEFDNLIIIGANTSIMSTLTGSTTNEVNSQINELSKKKDTLLSELKSTRAQAEAADRNFMDKIMHGPQEKELAPSLQDASLMLFWFGWLLMTLVIVAVRWLSPGGSWRSGLFTFVLMILVTMCVYAILQQVA